ncbi:MAG: RNA pseudouridine synthase [Pseudomonadales bacterium]|nr:RNA pseudouridine synthase [Pseudomonadales bacterium]
MVAMAPDSILKKNYQLSENVASACDWLAQETGLPKGRIKLAMTNGAVQVKKPNSKWQRLRRATASLPAGTGIRFFYNPQLLAIKPAMPVLLDDRQQYSVWFKPPGLMSQGNEWGDHCSILRLVELHFNNQRKVFPIHRLDQEACGLILIAHHKKTAAQLSELFSGRDIEKQYRVRVEGKWNSDVKRIEIPLDNKLAITNVAVLEQSNDSTLLLVNIETGRKHQIRRHLSQMGHAVRGDAQYGVKNSQVLHLAATKLSYQCPVQGRLVTYELASDQIDSYWQ